MWDIMRSSRTAHAVFFSRFLGGASAREDEVIIDYLKARRQHTLLIWAWYVLRRYHQAREHAHIPGMTSAIRRLGTVNGPYLEQILPFILWNG